MFKRYSKDRNELLCVCNFSPFRIVDYVIGVDESGNYEEIFTTDDETFGGTNEHNGLIYSSIMNKNGKTNAIRVNIPANTTLLIRKIQKD